MNAAAMKRPVGRGEEAAIRALLAIARQKFAADLHMDVALFDQPVWEVSALRDRSTSLQNQRLYFTQRGTTDQALPAAYGNVVKSWIILDRRSVGNMGSEVGCRAHSVGSDPAAPREKTGRFLVAKLLRGGPQPSRTGHASELE